MAFEIGLIKKNLRFRKIKPKRDSRDTKGNLNLTGKKETARDSFKQFVPRVFRHIYLLFSMKETITVIKITAHFSDYVVLLDKNQCCVTVLQ